METAAPIAEEMPLVLAVEPQAPAWAQHTVRFLQTGELPEEQEETEKVTRRSALYQFVNDVLYRRRPNGVKLKCIPREEGLELLRRYTEAYVAPIKGRGPLLERRSGKVSSGPPPSRMRRH